MNIEHADSNSNSNFSDSDFLLASLRTATLRARLAANEFDTIGIALRRGLVSPDEAVAWLHDANLFDHVIYRPN